VISYLLKKFYIFCIFTLPISSSTTKVLMSYL